MTFRDCDHKYGFYRQLSVLLRRAEGSDGKSITFQLKQYVVRQIES